MSYLVVSSSTGSLFCQHSWSSCCLVSFNLRITCDLLWPDAQLSSIHPSTPGSKVSVSAEETESSQPSREVSRPTPPQPVGRMSGGPAQRWSAGHWALGIGVIWSLRDLTLQVTQDFTESGSMAWYSVRRKCWKSSGQNWGQFKKKHWKFEMINFSKKHGRSGS